MYSRLLCLFCDYHLTDPTYSSKQAPSNTSLGFLPLTSSHSAHPEMDGSKADVHLQNLAVHLPSQHPGRKSVLSFKVPPVDSRAQQRNITTVFPTKPPKGNGEQSASTCGGLDGSEHSIKETLSNGIENTEPKFSVDAKKPQFFWETTLLETHDDVNEKEQDSNCKTQ